MSEEKQVIQEGDAYVKLFKTSNSKGTAFSWEIKCFKTTTKKELEYIQEQINELNNNMMELFGGTVE